MGTTELKELFPGAIKVKLPNSDREFAVHELRMADLDSACGFLAPYQTAMNDALALAKEQGVDINTVSNAQVLYDVIIKHRAEAMSFCSVVSSETVEDLKKLSLTQLMILLGAGVGANAGFFLNVIVRVGVRAPVLPASSPPSSVTVTATETSAVTP